MKREMNWGYSCLAACVAALLACLLGTAIAGGSAAEPSFDWQRDWAVEDGFVLSIDSEGYAFPTAISFVPNPGPNADDPLYFVTELRGTLKVVSNDRTVHTFATDFFNLVPEKDLPASEGEVGLAGICLAPKQGYIFVTFAYQDHAGVLRNNIVRFESKPETFSLKPSSHLSFTEVFSAHRSAASHQIGPCQVRDQILYVSMGDALRAMDSQNLDVLGGKVARMTLDGKPVPDNPFYEDGDLKKAKNYIWAYGFRNPFGLKMVEDKIFVAENGLAVDRFALLQKGENYLWDGTDWSMGAKAITTLSPPIGPVQVDYYSRQLSFFSETYNDTFFVAASGNLIWTSTPSEQMQPGIVTVALDRKHERLRQTPDYFLKYRGHRSQMVAGLGFGPDGLYFAPLYPNDENRSMVIKIVYSPAAIYPYPLSLNQDAGILMQKNSCWSCHRAQHKGGAVGPAIDAESLVSRLEERLRSQDYLQSLRKADCIKGDYCIKVKQFRQEILSEKSMDKKIHIWIRSYLQEPRFDGQNSSMPNLGLSAVEAKILTDALLKQSKRSFIATFTSNLFPNGVRTRHLLFVFIAGVILTFIPMLSFAVCSRR